MRKYLSLLLTLCLLAMAGPGAAESHFTMAGYDPASIGHDWINNLFFQRMEKKTGVSFTFRQYSDEAEYRLVLKGMLEGGELPDALFKASLSTAETQRLYAAGVLIDLKPLLQENATHLWALLQEHPDWAKAVTTPEGAIPALPQFNELPSNDVIWINQKWLRLCNLEMPDTAEELTEVLRAFKSSDPNRNGKADEVPLTFTGFWELRFLGHAFGLVANDYYLCADDDGQVRSVMTSDENRAFLTWLRQLWEEKLIDRNGLLSSDTLRRVTDADAAITYGVTFGPSVLTMLPTTALGDFTALTPLEYGGTRQYRSLLSEVTRGTFAITKACSDPAALLRWVDMLYTDEGLYLAYVGEEGVEYSRSADGKWYWELPASEVSSYVLADVTISEGAPVPGYITAEYQLSLDDAQTHATMEQLAELASHCRLPLPMVWLTEEEQAELDSFWPALSRYAEQQMVWFMTGDQPLNDETWAAFCAEAERLGCNRAAEIFQAALAR